MTEIAFSEDEAFNRYSQAQSTLQDHGDKITAHDPTGIDDPEISAALDKHNKRAKDNIDAAGKSMEKGKRAVTGLGDRDRENASRTGKLTPGEAAALKSALSRSSPSGGPAMAPAAMQAPAPTAAPAPASAPMMAPPPAVPAGFVNVAPEAVQSLLKGANFDGAPMGASGSGRAGGKDPIEASKIDFRKTGLEPLTKSQTIALADRAMDNNGYTRDPQKRAVFREILLNQWEHESSRGPDAVNDYDRNNSGPEQVDGYRENCSRGIAQVTAETFMRHHVAGTSNRIYDPESNGSAGVAYMMAKWKIGTDGSNIESVLAERRAANYGAY